MLIIIYLCMENNCVGANIAEKLKMPTDVHCDVMLWLSKGSLASGKSKLVLLFMSFGRYLYPG